MVSPKVNSASQRQLDSAAEQFEKFDESVKALTVDHMNKSVIPETEPQVKASNRELNKADAPYIKPVRSINSKEPFNEKYREAHTEAWKYVKCVVENLEIIGETVECWTKKFPGDPAHFWKVPVNKPVYIPKLLADQLASCCYHRLSMEQNQTSNLIGSDGMGTYVGSMVVDSVKHRIDARPVGYGFIGMNR